MDSLAALGEENGRFGRLVGLPAGWHLHRPKWDQRDMKMALWSFWISCSSNKPATKTRYHDQSYGSLQLELASSLLLTIAAGVQAHTVVDKSLTLLPTPQFGSEAVEAIRTNESKDWDVSTDVSCAAITKFLVVQNLMSLKHQ